MTPLKPDPMMAMLDEIDAELAEPVQPVKPRRLYVIAYSRPQFEVLKNRLMQLGVVDHCYMITEFRQLAGLRNIRVYILPQGLSHWTGCDKQDLRSRSQASKISLFTLTDSAFNRSLEELDEAISTDRNITIDECLLS